MEPRNQDQPLNSPPGEAEPNPTGGPDEPPFSLGFLAEAGRVLAASLDHQATLASLAQLCVPTLADWCVVDALPEGHTLHRVAIAHRDAAKAQRLYELRRRFPPDLQAPHGVGQVLRTGQPELYHDFTNPQLAEFARDAEELHLLRELGPRSVLILPLAAHGRTVGALTLVFAESGRRHGPGELILAQVLAHLAALAIDNAQLASVIADSARHKDEFLAMLAHELRNPLAPIRNAVHMLMLDGANARTLDWARDVLQRQVGHVSRFVDDLLEVSRIARGKIVLRRQLLDLSELVRTACADHRCVLEGAGLDLVLELTSEPLPVFGDADRLAQVMDNLLSNAAKFTEVGGRVTVQVKAAGERATVRVRDTGQGIARELLPRLFDVFTQADRTLDRRQGGLGLGLALVRGLLELHGGEVWAASAGLGHGAEFTFSLPREPTPMDSAITTLFPAVAADGLRIVLIEDNPDVAESMRLLLELTGHEVAVAHTGKAGLELARQFRPDVILCDLGLPELDGFAVARALRREPATAGAHLIAVTGYGQEDDRRRSRAAGFDLHLTKPVDPMELHQLLAAFQAAMTRTGV